MQRATSFLGLAVMVLLAWAMSSHRTKVSLRIVLGGLLLQFSFAALILKTDTGAAAFDLIGDFFQAVLGFVDSGTAFLFDIFPR
ncbi:MAG: hypothetical protein KDA89_06535, partial [Planctomycetaceae bacterium]|nr:hypothetical protein [Planctomycetaceae bacterium]